MKTKLRLLALTLATCHLSLVPSPALRAQSPVADLIVQRTVVLGNGTTTGKPGTISPAQLTADTDDWAPTGFAYAFTVRVDTDASHNLTGVAGGAAGRVFVLENIGAEDLVLTNADTDSTDINRFALSADFTLSPDSSVLLKYDGVSSRWRIVGSQTAASTAAGTVTHTGGALTANYLVLGAGTDDTKVAAGLTTDGTSKLVLGVAGTSVGSIDFKNATSGTINLAPPTGALGTVNLVLPGASGTLATLAGTEAFTNKTVNGVTLTTGGSATAFLNGAGSYAATGDVVGPASATDARLVLMDSTSGKLIMQSTAFTASGGTITSNTSFTIASASASNIVFSPGTSGRVTIAKPAESSVREILFNATVSDGGNDRFDIANFTSANSRFIPVFAGYVDSGSDVPSLAFRSLVSSANDASDSSTPGMITFDAVRTNSSSDPNNGTFSNVVNRRLFTWRNNNTILLRVSPSGFTNDMTTASTSTTTGSLINAGGFGNAGALYNGGILAVTNATEATNSTTAALKTAGGLAVAKKIITADSITTGAPSGGTAAAWKFGVVASVSPTSPDRTVELDVGGTRYFLAAKTTND